MKHFYKLVLIIAMGAFVQAQTAGQEYFPYSFCTSSQSGCTNGIDGSGNYTSTVKFGASAATNAAYATPTTANGEAHTPNRMWKLFKKGNATSPQFVAFDFDVPPGVYTYSVYTRWAVEVDYNAETANKPFLKIMGKNIFHAGDLGSGNGAKICNNMSLGVAMIVASESLMLAKRLNIEIKKVTEIMQNA